MIGLILLIPILALLLLDYFIADEFHAIAVRKGHCGRKYFWWCFFTGFVGYVMVAALPDKSFLRTEAPEKPQAGCRICNYC